MTTRHELSSLSDCSSYNITLRETKQKGSQPYDGQLRLRQRGIVDNLVRRYNGGESLSMLAFEEGIQIKSLLQRFRRAGYRYDVLSTQYSKSPNIGRQMLPSRRLPQRLVEILLQCKGVKADRVSVSIRLNFETIEDMDQYMKQFYYEWSEERHVYMPVHLPHQNM